MEKDLKIAEKRFMHQYHAAFYKLFHLPLDWLQEDSKNFTICGKSHCNPLCVRIMEHPKGAALCRAMDRNSAQEGIKGKTPVVRQCHAGLWDALIPIFSGEQYLGSLCVGQYLHKMPDKKECEEIRKRLSFLDLSEGELEGFYKNTRILSREEEEGLLDLVQMIGQYITESYGRIRFLESVATEEPVMVAREYMKKHFARKLTVTGIAQAVNMSKSYFVHKFTTFIGQSPMAFLNCYRAEQAKELLLNSSFRITEIADLCGFRNVYAMNRAFHHLYNTSPQKFRQEEKKEKGSG